MKISLARLGAVAVTIALATVVVSPAQSATPTKGRITGHLHASGVKDFTASAGSGDGYDVLLVSVTGDVKDADIYHARHVEVTGDGDYAISGIPPGRYLVGAFGGGREDAHEFLFYPQVGIRSRATVITVRAGESVHGIDFSLARGASLSGTLKDVDGQPTSQPQGGATVEVFDADRRFVQSVASNDWHFDGMPAGQYYLHVEYQGSRPALWFAGTDENGAQPVTLGRSQAKTVNVRLRTNPAIASTGRPAISGTLKVGRTLTASDGSWASAPDSFTYQWFRDGSRIWGATSRTRTLTTSDRGKHLTVRVGAKKYDTVTGTRTSLRTGSVKP